MKFLGNICILWLCVTGDVVETTSDKNNADLGEIIFVNVIFRHGARTPDKTYKNDPYKNAFREGLGELTNVGKNQEYELGKWLRRRYDALLTDTYSPDLLYVMSSDFDRVLMSAQCNLAGIFPPKSWQVWNKDLDWQPIPVHTVPQSMDKLLAMKAPCPAYDKELNNVLASEEVKRLSAKYQCIVDVLNKETGESRNDYKYIANMYDTLFVQDSYNWTLPEWTKDIFPQPMANATVLRFALPTWNTKLARLKSGPILREIISNMEKNIKGESTRVMNMYAGHDTTIANILNALNIWDKQLLPYAACVMVELRRDIGGAYYVTIFYLKGPSADPLLLSLPGCEAACPLDKFISLTGPVVPQDWVKECSDTN